MRLSIAVPAALLLILLSGLVGLDEVLLAPARSGAPWWPWITRLGDREVRLVATVVASALLWGLRGRLEALLMLATGAMAAVVSWGLKIVVGRPRPPDGLVEVLSGSFPSGHALGSTATYVAAAVLAAPGNRPAAMAAAGLAALVGASRMALGVHYLSDVAAGWLLGLLLVMAAAALRSRIRQAQGGARHRAGAPPGREPPAGP